MAAYRAALWLPVVVAACATPAPQGTLAWTQQRYEAATRYCDNEYRKQWKEYLTGLELVSSDYAKCLERAKVDYLHDMQLLKSS